jgi:hypothetical protein
LRLGNSGESTEEGATEDGSAKNPNFHEITVASPNLRPM